MLYIVDNVSVVKTESVTLLTVVLWLPFTLFTAEVVKIDINCVDDCKNEVDFVSLVVDDDNDAFEVAVFVTFGETFSLDFVAADDGTIDLP